MEKIGLTNRPNLAIAEKSAEADFAQMMLDEAGIVVGSAKEVFAAAGAAA